MARKIITLTLNTSIDVSIEIPGIVDNSVVDASSHITVVVILPRETPTGFPALSKASVLTDAEAETEVRAETD